MSMGQRIVVTAAACVLLSAVGQQAWAAAVVQSPTNGSTTVMRTVPGQDGGQSTPYVVERVGASVKYEDAPVGLGEDNAIHSDTFVIRVTGAGDSVKVETKAGRHVAKWVSGENATNVDDNGFKIELLSINGDLYTIRLSSTAAARYALSHVTFTFTEGTYRDAAYD